MNLDKIDKQILQILQDNAQISNLELAEQVNLSPTPCARRVKQLEATGIIQRHITVLDQAKLGLTLTAMVSVTLDRHSADYFDDFEKEATKLPEIIECYIVTGRESDFLLKVVVRDMQHYEQFVLRRLTRIKGVSGVHTSFVLRQPIQKYQLPIGI